MIVLRYGVMFRNIGKPMLYNCWQQPLKTYADTLIHLCYATNYPDKQNKIHLFSPLGVILLSYPGSVPHRRC